MGAAPQPSCAPWMSPIHDRAIAAFVGAALSWIGLIHGAQLGWGAAPMVALGYAMFGVVCLLLSRQGSEEAA